MLTACVVLVVTPYDVLDATHVYVYVCAIYLLDSYSPGDTGIEPAVKDDCDSPLIVIEVVLDATQFRFI